MPDADPLEGQEISMLNQLLAQAWPLAKAGDAEAADRVIKILQAKAQREARAERRAKEAAAWRKLV